MDIDSFPAATQRWSVRSIILKGHRTAGGAFTAGQNKALEIVALTCASISIVATMVTLYWFATMKRRFRHHLILVLIVSDMFKAIWYFVYPIVGLTTGPVKNSSNYCQASGFLLAFGLEASDYAVLMIALHTALYIFRPPVRLDEGGLFPYRHMVYALWIILPTLAASLAFVGTKKGYTTAGTYCYLPKRPFWYRLALAWIPRYLIFFTITTLYVAIYVYVRIKFKGFSDIGKGEQRRLSSSQKGPGDVRRPSAHSEDLLFSSTDGSTLGSDRRKPFDTQVVTPIPNARVEEHDTVPEWERYEFITTTPIADGSPPSGYVDDTVARQPSDSSQVPNGDQVSSGHFPGKTQYLPESAFPSSQPTATTSNAISGGRRVDPLDQTRVAIRRQLRFMFIYPLIYMLAWVIPFVTHCFNYSDYYVRHPVFGVSVIATGILALQSAIDCIVFGWRERPWRRRDDSAKDRLVRIISPSRRRSHVPRKSTEQDEHLTLSAALRETGEGGHGFATAPLKKKKTRHWWDVEAMHRKESIWMTTSNVSSMHHRSTLELSRSQTGQTS